MNDLIAVETDALTNKTIERQMTDDEITQYKKDIEAAKKAESDALAAQQAREASIRKMAEASGLTEAEIEALF